MILSDDTNGAGGANLTPLICLLLHHHQLTSLILLHQHQLTSTRVCPIWPISLACGSGPFLWSKHKTKIAQIELNYVQIQILLLCNLKGTTGCLKAICLLWEPPICKISWVHVSLYLLFASLCQLDGRMPSAQPSFDSSPNRPVRTVYPIPSQSTPYALLSFFHQPAPHLQKGRSYYSQNAKCLWQAWKGIQHCKQIVVVVDYCHRSAK